jgi:hypothetical protein
VKIDVVVFQEHSPGFPDLRELSLAIGANVSPILGAGGVGIDNDFIHRYDWFNVIYSKAINDCFDSCILYIPYPLTL